MREFGSEFEIEYARDSYFDNLCEFMPNYAFTRSGRESIGLAARAIKAGIVLMPAYCCWSMEIPFEKAGWSIEYYRLNDDLSVDKSYLSKQIEIFLPKVILVVNYFGFVPTKDIVSFIKSKNSNILVLEDFTQSLFCLPENFNPKVDAYMASIRKSIGVSDGGIIITSLPIIVPEVTGENTPFVYEHIKAGREKRGYRYTGIEEDKMSFREKQSIAGKNIKENYEIYKISNEAYSVIQHTIVDNVKIARYHNYKNLYNIISANPKIRVLFAPSILNQAPFAMIICTEERSEVQNAMVKAGIYAQVLWPLKDKAKEICPISKYMEEHMLAIPIDQRYFYDDIQEMGERINSVVK